MTALPSIVLRKQSTLANDLQTRCPAKEDDACWRTGNRPRLGRVTEPGKPTDVEIDKLVAAVPGYLGRKTLRGIGWALIGLGSATWYLAASSIFWGWVLIIESEFLEHRGWLNEDSSVVATLAAWVVSVGLLWLALVFIAMAVGRPIWSLGARLADPDMSRELRLEDIFGQHIDYTGDGHFRPRWFTSPHAAEERAKQVHEEAARRHAAAARRVEIDRRQRRIDILLYGDERWTEQWGRTNTETNYGRYQQVGRNIVTEVGREAADELRGLMTVDGGSGRVILNAPSGGSLVPQQVLEDLASDRHYLELAYKGLTAMTREQ